MEGECHESSGLRGRVAALNPGVDLKLEQAALPPVESDRMLAARLRPLHHGHPLVVV